MYILISIIIYFNNYIIFSKYKGVDIITYLINKYVDNYNIKFYLFSDFHHKFNNYPN